MADSLQQFAGKLHRYQSELERVPKQGVTAVAVLAKRNIEVAMGKPVLIVPRAKKRRVSPFYTVTGTGATAKAVVAMRGAAPLVERDTKPHREPKTSKRGGRKLLSIPGIGVRASVMHPGTKGKHPFQHGIEATIPLAGRTFEAEVHKAGLAVFH